MCKLCRSADVGRISNIEFSSIVYMYTGEYPCTSCKEAFRKRRRTDIDEYVIRKLLRVYGNSRRLWESMEPKVSTKKMRKKVINPDLPVGTGSYTKVEKWISKHSICRTGTTWFTVSVYKKGHKTRISFKTLKEAREFKQRIINEHKRP